MCECEAVAWGRSWSWSKERPCSCPRPCSCESRIRRACGSCYQPKAIWALHPRWCCWSSGCRWRWCRDRNDSTHGPRSWRWCHLEKWRRTQGRHNIKVDLWQAWQTGQRLGGGQRQRWRRSWKWWRWRRCHNWWLGWRHHGGRRRWCERPPIHCSGLVTSLAACDSQAITSTGWTSRRKCNSLHRRRCTWLLTHPAHEAILCDSPLALRRHLVQGAPSLQELRC